MLKDFFLSMTPIQGAMFDVVVISLLVVLLIVTVRRM